MLERLRRLGDEKGAVITVLGDPEPDLLDGLPGERVGRARMLDLVKEIQRLMDDRLVNWTAVAYPNEGWARTMFGDPDVERLWQAVAYCTRLDEPDLARAWREHIGRLKRRADALNVIGVDAVRFRGPGTDLTIGLLPNSRWDALRVQTAWGQPFLPNVPTEEVFTTPDARRAVGTIRSTRPLPLLGTIVRDLELRFEGGRIVDVRASAGADVIRGHIETDDGARSLGEVALVDRTSRVGETGLTFFNILYDENASCHIAYGGAVYGVEGEAGAGYNVSAVHTDVMVGGPEVDVDVVTREGRTIPVLRDDAWVLSEAR
jgi:aminopeptidase